MCNFLFRREAVKQQLLGETSETREKSKKGTLLCAKSHKKKKKKIPYSSAFNDGKLIQHYNQWPSALGNEGEMLYIYVNYTERQ